MVDIQRQAEEEGAEVDTDDLEQATMCIVLGRRRDWETGIGHSIPRGALLLAAAQDASSSSSSFSRTQHDPAVSVLQSTVQAQQAMMEEMHRQIF